MSGFLGFAVREMSVWQLINASSHRCESPTAGSGTQNALTALSLFLSSLLALFLSLQHLVLGALRLLQTARPSDALRFVYGKTNTWLIEVCASRPTVCVCGVCVCFGRCPLLMAG